VDVAYKAPHGQPNGLAQGSEAGQLWVQDRGRGRQVTLIRAADGSVIREIQAEAIGPSGIGLDDDGTMWTSDTHGVMLVRFDPKDGATLGKYFVPGATRIYEKVGDAPQRVSPLKRAYPDEPRALGDSLPNNERNNTGSGLGPGRVDPKTDHFWSATGSAGIACKGDLLLYSNLSARAIFSVHKKTWQVQDVWPTPGNRPLGLCWADAARSSFWSADANLQILYRYDAATGAIREAIQLPEGSPVLHGCQIVGNQMYFTDDTGWICRFRMPG
jgi:streptogramin lyase